MGQWNRVFPCGMHGSICYYVSQLQGILMASYLFLFPVFCQSIPWPPQESGWLVAQEMSSIYAKGEGRFSLPTNQITHAMQVNPFIVMKWRSMMYCRCKMLKQVLAFLWGRRSHGDVENRVLERHRNYPSKHDADMAQNDNTLMGIRLCVYTLR